MASDDVPQPILIVRDECQDLVVRDSKSSPDFDSFPPSLPSGLSAEEWFDLLIASLPKEH